jgi:uncharacterized protein (TIGR04255 family)
LYAWAALQSVAQQIGDQNVGIRYHDHLPNKPLVEAILEVKWGSPDKPDPGYPMIVGRLYEKVRGEYPYVQDLELAQFPPGVAVHIPRHRFRTAENRWPLVQIGPGVAVLNDTEQYAWEDFRRRATAFFPQVREALPRPDELDITSLKLQYIDAVEVDYSATDVQAFLRDKLHISVKLPESLFEGQPLLSRAAHAVMELAFPSSSPAGRIELSVRTGQKEGLPALILQTSVWSPGTDASSGWESFGEWLDAAHRVIRHWFFALIEGDLERQFLGK